MASLLLRLILVRRIRMPQLKSQWTPLKTLKVLLAIKVGLFLWIWPTHQTQIEKKNPCNMTLIQFFITDPLQTGLQCTEVLGPFLCYVSIFLDFFGPTQHKGYWSSIHFFSTFDKVNAGVISVSAWLLLSIWIRWVSQIHKKIRF